MPRSRSSVKSPYAISYLAHAPGPIGLARAYVTGHLDIKGDMYTALSRMQAALGSTLVEREAHAPSRHPHATRSCARPR